MTFEEMDAFIAEHEDIVCPVCGKHNFTPIRKFNLMFKTVHRRYRGLLLDLLISARRPRRAFSSTSRNVQRTTRRKLPYRRLPGRQGVPQRDHAGQLHRSARASLSRWSCEFFCNPKARTCEWFAYWKDYCKNCLLSLGMQGRASPAARPRAGGARVLLPRHDRHRICSSRSPTGASCGALRTERITTSSAHHGRVRARTLRIRTQLANEKYVPYCIEPSLGCGPSGARVSLRRLRRRGRWTRRKTTCAPFCICTRRSRRIKCAVLPLSKKLAPAADRALSRAAEGIHGGL